jgi:hypothetical protein
MPFPYKDDALKAYLGAQKVALMPQQQYFDSFHLDVRGVTAEPNHETKKKLGFAEVQQFSKAMRDAVSLVASTSLGDDCGEGAFSSVGALATVADPAGLFAAWNALYPPAPPR